VRETGKMHMFLLRPLVKSLVNRHLEVPVCESPFNQTCSCIKNLHADRK